MDKKSALQRFRQSREKFRQALQKMDERNDLTLPIEGFWTAKDLIGHLTAWEKLVLLPLQSFVVGGKFNPEIIPDHDAFNLLESDKRKNMSLKDLFAEADEVSNHILEVFTGITEEQCQQSMVAPWGGSETLAQQIDGLGWHADDHLNSILRWINQNNPSDSKVPD